MSMHGSYIDITKIVVAFTSHNKQTFLTQPTCQKCFLPHPCHQGQCWCSYHHLDTQGKVAAICSTVIRPKPDEQARMNQTLQYDVCKGKLGYAGLNVQQVAWESLGGGGVMLRHWGGDRTLSQEEQQDKKNCLCRYVSAQTITSKLIGRKILLSHFLVMGGGDMQLQSGRSQTLTCKKRVWGHAAPYQIHNYD